MMTPKIKTTWFYYSAGSLMTGHFLFNLVYMTYSGQGADIFWLSHVGTLTAGLGALLANRLLISVALVALLQSHSWWIADAGCWLITGRFWTGITDYLATATWIEWVVTANHFYVLPLLLVLAYLMGGVDKWAWVWAGPLFAVLVLISFFFLPPAANVNCAHRLWPSLENGCLARIGTLSCPWYQTAMIAINVLGNFLPANLGLYALSRVLRKRRGTTIAKNA